MIPISRSIASRALVSPTRKRGMRSNPRLRVGLTRIGLTSLVFASLCTGSANAQSKHERVEFTRLIAHWAEYADDDYLKFVEDARPDICQIGFYGGHFYGLAHTEQYKGYPAHFPV